MEVKNAFSVGGPAYVSPPEGTQEMSDGAAPVDEAAFQRWYSDIAKKVGINPDPDDPQHFYDYRAAYKAGVVPTEESGWHWPSEFKREGHPRMIVDGVNTKTGVPQKAYE